MTIYTVDLDGRITFLNRSWARFAQANGAPQLCDERAVLGSSIWDAITDAAVRHLNPGARISLCGQISQYNLEVPETGPRWLGMVPRMLKPFWVTLA